MARFRLPLGLGATAPTASVGAAPSVLTSFALVSLDFTGSTDPAGGGLTYSATMDVKPTGSASSLVDSTTSTPDFTPDKIGTYSGVLTVTDINGRTDTSRWFREVRSALSVSIAAVADQLDLAAATLDSTVTGGVTPYTYAWTVDGATTGLSSSTAADPTYTPTGAGTPTAVVTVTDAAGQTAKASVTWRVGTTTGWVLLWSTANAADSNLKTTSPVTVNGKSVYADAAADADTLAFSGGLLSVDSKNAGVYTGVRFYPSEILTTPRDVLVCFMIGLSAGLDNSDICRILYNNAGSNYTVAFAEKTAGAVQRACIGRSGAADDNTNTAGAGQVRVLSLEMAPGRYSSRAKYRETAWSDNAAPPSPDDLTLNAGGPTSGWFTMNVLPVDTADLFNPNTVPGAGADYVQVAVSGTDTILSLQIAMWAKVPA